MYVPRAWLIAENGEPSGRARYVRVPSWETAADSLPSRTVAVSADAACAVAVACSSSDSTTTPPMTATATTAAAPDSTQPFGFTADPPLPVPGSTRMCASRR